MDKYEASVWEIPAVKSDGTSNAELIAKVREGTVTVADLTAGQSIQHGLGSEDYPCTLDGQTCKDKSFATSLPALPSGYITWFQAQQACGNSGKRLTTNAEWQMAVAGTPDPGPDNGSTDCNTASAAKAVPTGSRSACVSSWGAYDMVGNLPEWVADWGSASREPCGSWNISDDEQCLVGAGTAGEPGAFLRGGSSGHGTAAGPLTIGALSSGFGPGNFGFRCAR